jgi:hypothetical protein
MSYHYDDTPSRGSRIQDPSIDAWFRELRGDAPPPPEPRSAAAASRKRQRELDTEVEAWFRGGPDVDPRLEPPQDSWTVDTRTWAPDWDTGSTSYVPRETTNGRHHRHAARDRRSTGEQPRVPEHRPAPAPVSAPSDGRPSTGEQPRIAERPPMPRPIEARAIGSQSTEQRQAEIRDLNEAREARAARTTGPRAPSVPSQGPTVATHGYDDDPFGGYGAGYDPYHEPPGADYHASTIPAAAPAPAPPAAPGPPAAPAMLPAARAGLAYPGSAATPSPAPAYVPAPASPPSGYAAAPSTAPAYGDYSSGLDAGPLGYAGAPYTNGSLTAAPGFPEPHEVPPYDSLLPEPRPVDSQFDVVLPDSAGNPMLAFKNGQWFKLGAGGITSSPITVRSAVLEYSDMAGSVVQILCWWMRENSRRERSLDIATELALAVTELTHMADLRTKTPAFY